MNLRMATMLAGILMLAGCAGTSKVMLATPRPPIDPAQVRLYPEVPPGAVQIAQIQATSGAGFDTQGQTDAALARLKKAAAEVGANGVVLIGVDSQRSGGGVSIGAGSYGGHVGGGLGIGIPTTRKQANGVAIWVPTQP